MRKAHYLTFGITIAAIVLQFEAWVNLRVLSWTVAIVLLTCSGICIVGNLLLVRRVRVFNEHHSLIPLIGGLSGCLGLLVLPVHLTYLCWLPFVLDLGTWIIIVALWNWKRLAK